MERLGRYQMNIAAELVMGMVLVLLLVTCLIQRKRLRTTRQLSINDSTYTFANTNEIATATVEVTVSSTNWEDFIYHRFRHHGEG